MTQERLEKISSSIEAALAQSLTFLQKGEKVTVALRISASGATSVESEITLAVFDNGGAQTTIKRTGSCVERSRLVLPKP